MKTDTQKTMVITGGTGGIGIHTAIGLAKTGARIVVTGRNIARGQRAVARIQTEAQNPCVELVVGDLSNFAGICALATALLQRCKTIDVLINNAGMLASTRAINADGFEQNFAVNVVAPYALTQQLRPALTAAKPSRVLNVTGGLSFDKLDIHNLQAEKGFTALPSYSHTKRAMEAASLAQGRALTLDGIYLNIVYPGGASTAMTHAVTPAALPWYGRIFWPLLARKIKPKEGEKSAQEASRSSIFAATTPALQAASGLYYDRHSKLTSFHKTVLDQNNQAKVLDTIIQGIGHQKTPQHSPPSTLQ